MLQALSPELALMFLPQPRGEFVVRLAITAHDTLTHSIGLTIGSMDASYWGQGGDAAASTLCPLWGVKRTWQRSVNVCVTPVQPQLPSPDSRGIRLPTPFPLAPESLVAQQSPTLLPLSPYRLRPNHRRSSSGCRKHDKTQNNDAAGRQQVARSRMKRAAARIAHRLKPQ